MRAWADPALAVWAAALCACLAALAMYQQEDTRRRAQRLLKERDARSTPWSVRGSDPVRGRPGSAALACVRAALMRLRDEARRVLAAASGGPPRVPRSGERQAGWALRPDPSGDRATGPAGRGTGRRLARPTGSVVASGGGAEPSFGGSAGGVPGPGAPDGWFGGRRRVELLCLPAGGLVAVATGSVLPLLVGVAALPLAGRALRRTAARAAEERGAAAVSALCGTVAGDLRAGRPPHVALVDAVESAGWARSPELARAARLLLSAARFGGDVPLGLREASRSHPGAHGLAAVAACWQVAVDGGAGLAAALDRVAAALRADADQRDDLRAQLAGPRSTAVLLALLPLFGIVLGAGLGADPSGVLLHTHVGQFCLLTGGLLEWAGLAWTARIIRTAEDGPGGQAARGSQRKRAGRIQRAGYTRLPDAPPDRSAPGSADPADPSAGRRGPMAEASAGGSGGRRP